MKSLINFRNLLLTVFVSLQIIITGCTTNKIISIPIPKELVSNNQVKNQVFNSSFAVEFLENPEIEHYYDLEESIGEALKDSLTYSNIFGKDSDKPYLVTVTVVDWDIPKSDPGLYNCRLKTRYVVYDEKKRIIFEKEVFTEAHSDVAYFADYKRSRKAATLNVAKNINLFVAALIKELESKVVDAIEKQPANKNESIESRSLVEDLQKLTDLHSSGALTDEEFKAAKQKLINSGSK
ncbi:SHOCT domain-containing protein [bacterium]|nr:SHOCT domain-containing protein [bacterium]